MFGKREYNLFDATYDYNIYAWMQMKNYRAYFKGDICGFGLSKGKLRLRIARRSKDLKKIPKELSILSRLEDVGSCMLYLEGEENFRSAKRKLDVSISNATNSYKLEKANFFKYVFK